MKTELSIFSCWYMCSTLLLVLMFRLLDASAVPVGTSVDLTLVLEYIDQDLSTYLSKAPASGLSRDCIKVSTRQLTDTHRLQCLQILPKLRTIPPKRQICSGRILSAAVLLFCPYRI